MASYTTVDADAMIYRGQEDDDDPEEIPVQPLEISYESSRYDESATLDVSGLVTVSEETLNRLPQSNTLPVGLTCSINGTLIGGGTLVSSEVDGDGVWEGTAYDCVRNLAQNTVTRQQGGSHLDAARDIFTAAGIPPALDEPDIDGTPQYSLDAPQSVIDAIQGERGPLWLMHYRNAKGFQNTPCTEALTELLQEYNWHWWVDTGNVVHVAPDLPTREVEVPYITEMSAGKETPPWQQVRVVGNHSTAADAADPDVDSNETLIGKGDPITATAGNGAPVYEHVDKSIMTEETAQSLANAIMEELARQQGGGSVTAVGMEDVRPLDVIELPTHLGGESYLVSGVIHDASSSNGFTTEIECGGLIGAGPGGRLNTVDLTEDDLFPGTGEGEGEVGEPGDGRDRGSGTGTATDPETDTGGAVQGPSGG